MWNSVGQGNVTKWVWLGRTSADNWAVYLSLPQHTSHTDKMAPSVNIFLYSIQTMYIVYSSVVVYQIK